MSRQEDKKSNADDLHFYKKIISIIKIIGYYPKVKIETHVEILRSTNFPFRKYEKI